MFDDRYQGLKTFGDRYQGLKMFDDRYQGLKTFGDRYQGLKICGDPIHYGISPARSTIMSCFNQIYRHLTCQGPDHVNETVRTLDTEFDHCTLNGNDTSARDFTF